MSMEIRWDDKIVQLEEGASAEHMVWTRLSAESYSVQIGGQTYTVSAVEGPGPDGKMVVRVGGVEREVQVLDERAQLLDRMGMSAGSGMAELELCAPMPGKVLNVLVAEGDTVESGDSLLVLEAMKMENVIKASMGGVIESVPANAGEAVEKGQLLLKFAG